MPASPASRNMRTRVKICGITNSEDALSAVAAGADALGFVFYAKSPRVVQVEQVKDICDVLPPMVTRVGLFLNPDSAEVDNAVRVLPLDLLQFHGTESAAECAAFGLPYMKALGAGSAKALRQQALSYDDASALLFDSHQSGNAGGTGETFDWSTLPDDLNKPVILAGGLNIDNVEQAIRAVRPYAVDVSSGVEKSPGIKDAALMKEFIARAKCADRSE